MAGLHVSASRLLEAWQAPDMQQDALRIDYLAHLQSHSDAMLRECVHGHLTASALIVDAVNGRVLLTLHPKVGRWLQTGGHCEPADADICAAALREATEESGIVGITLDAQPLRLDRHSVRCGPGEPRYHLDVQFLAVSPTYAPIVQSEESLDLRWWHWDSLPEGVDESVRLLTAAARDRV